FVILHQLIRSMAVPQAYSIPTRRSSDLRHVGDRVSPGEELPVRLMQSVDEELDADECEDRRDSVVEVDEFVDESAQEEVELAQSHEGEDVRCEDEERTLGDTEDRGDRIER